MGDFNDLLYMDDKRGNAPHPHILMNGFRNDVDDCHISELELFGGKFTWERIRYIDAWVREKLDRVFANASWWAKFPLCKLIVIHTPCSDHEPIFLELLQVEISKRKFRFRFENIWLKEPNFITDVTEAWSNTPFLIFSPNS